MYISTWGRDLISSTSNSISNKTAFGAGWSHFESRFLGEVQTELTPKQNTSRLHNLAASIQEGNYKYIGRKKPPTNRLNYPKLHCFMSKDGDIACINNGKRNNGMLFPEIAIQDSDENKITRFLGSTLDSKGENQAIKKAIKAFETIIPKRKPRKAKTLAAPAMTQPMVRKDKYLQLA